MSTLGNDDGFLFGPSEGEFWDSARASCPVVLPDGGGYRIWYYGRERGFPGLDDGDRTALPSGRTGTAWSDDGIHFEKQPGRGVLGSVLDPSADSDAFDALQVGGTEVVRLGDGYRMYYVGSRRGSGLSYGETRTGWPTAIGAAESHDGLGFERVQPQAVLEHGAADAWDAYYVAFPRVMQVAGGWRLYYSAGGPQGRPGVGLAESGDGIHWEKRGQVFAVSDDPDACDAASVGSRSIIPAPGGYFMAYECVDAQGNFRIAMATSADGVRFERQPGRAPGGSMIGAGRPGSFSDRAVGTPYLVVRPSGSLRVYHVGFGTGGQGIGLQECDGSDLTRWTPVTV